MKVISKILILLFFCTSLYSQNKISPKLFEELQNKTKGTTDIIIYLNTGVDFEKLNKELIGADFDTRVKTVSRALKEIANNSQPDLINAINDFRKSNGRELTDIRSFWIINAINLKAESSLVYYLSELKSVRYLDLNSGRYSIYEPYDITKCKGGVKNNTEPGLKAINSHLLWEMGYTGLNMLFLSMDTGVFPEHPAIRDNFAGNHYPMDQCWFAVRNPEPTDHSSSSHGTHTTGTALGLDPATNDTIGVAYNAMWIASDPVAGGNEDLLNPVDFMDVFQWVLDPDGNPETTDDVPRVINNSWGYDYSLAAEFDACSMTEAEVLIAIETAGICSPFSAGNSGPGSTTTGFPALLAFNEVNPMAIGAVNFSNSIADFSSRGPTPCVEEEGALRIKPEVCAPGVSIRSCSGLDSYSMLSGTSMACPHVAGALLLLAEAFPNASAFELKNALYLSAIDLGEPGEDNIYGRGIIDVYAAFILLSETYDPKPPINNDYDIAVNIISPDKNELICDNGSIEIEFIISNLGELPIEGYTFELFHNNELIKDSIVTDTLQSNQIIELSHQINTLTGGRNNIRAIAMPIENLEEYSRFNNSDITYFSIIEQTVAPFFEDFVDFSANLMESDWYIINENRQKTWELTKWGADNSKALSINFRDYGSRNGEVDRALMPEFTVPEWDNVYLNFSYAYQKRLETLYSDSLLIQINTDCGQTFNNTIFAEGGENLATVPGNSHSVAFMPSSKDDFRNESINLNSFKNQNIIISFTAINDRGSALFIDKVEISDHDYSNIEKLNINTEIDIYPNPTKGIINYEVYGNSDNQQINLSLINIYGKIIFNKSLYKNNGKIDINHLPSGVYIIRIDTKKTIKTKRIIKL